MRSVATLAVIPARAGSIGLPAKHLRHIGGQPMIEHTVRAALAARSVTRVIVSTNDRAVARAARLAGAEVPFERPAALATTDAPTVQAIQHAVAWAEADGMTVDLVVTLQPTSPLRSAAEIDAAVALLRDASVRSAVSVAHLGLPVSVVGALKADRFVPAAASADRDARRQASPPAVRLTGGIYVTRRSLLAEDRLLDERPAALIVSQTSGIDVDTMEDLQAARRAWRAERRASS
jgi:CMP-N-acetylneuraminic acid synthetase